ncbi:MAG: biotin carboxylase N-terminal domain-containing protein [Acidimicrobiales bacterium]
MDSRPLAGRPTSDGPSKTIRTLLVANRGEIARRVFATARTMGITCVAVHSDADAGSPHVLEADLSVRLPGTSPADTYLRTDLLVEACLASGADAVHPGYGFLSESADFARAVLDAGVTWVGPPPTAIEAMGSKVAAKDLMRAAGVPTLPSLTIHGDATPDEDELAALGWPLLVKASAGGGGRGMRLVTDPDDLATAVTAARREAASAFGDGTVFLERFVTDPRHIEVQVLADTQGTTVALFERECSIQRRHQKIVEESPSPVVDAELRRHLGDAAVAAARAVGYVNAGTVEFVLEPSTGEVSFLEMNTRLQVEHPVTEAVSGLDLVRLQLLVAQGLPLPEEVHRAIAAGPIGHAVEARLYAEDPAAGWLPSTGPIHRFAVSPLDRPPVGDRTPTTNPVGEALPTVRAHTGGSEPPRDLHPAWAAWPARPVRQFRPAPSSEPGTATLRVDSGVETGSVVSPHYDSMLAKVIVHARSRAEALSALAGVLERAELHGPITNRDLLVRILRHDDVVAGRTDTGLIDRVGLDTLASPLADDHALVRHAVAAALAAQVARRAGATVQASLPTGWRNSPNGLQWASLTTGSGESERRVEVRYRFDRTGARLAALEVELDGARVANLVDRQPEAGGERADGTGVGADRLDVTSVGSDYVVVDASGVSRPYRVHRVPLDPPPGAEQIGPVVTYVDGPDGSSRLVEAERFAPPSAQLAAGSSVSPMPGGVTRVAVAVGDRVEHGDVLVVLEAMKMEHTVAAATSGTVTAVQVAAGDQVETGQVLVVVSPGDSPTGDGPTGDGPAGPAEGPKKEA